MKMIAFYNNKGGVGKTSTAINIAYTLSRRQNRILLVDFDGQCNSSRFFTDLANDECGCESAIVNAEEIEKEFFEHTSRLNSECFKNSLPNNLDDWEKAIINELEGVSEQVASGNYKKEPKSILTWTELSQGFTTKTCILNVCSKKVFSEI